MPKLKELPSERVDNSHKYLSEEELLLPTGGDKRPSGC